MTTTVATTSSQDTIFALSSGAATGQATAVAVIRLSGPQAGVILQRLTPGRPLPKPRTAALRKLHDLDDPKVVLDQALVLYFSGPNSFTGDDVVELQVHGSRAVVTAVLETLGTAARLAEPGEFTQRAWLAGKLDALQVEALADLLTADTATQRQQALAQLDGQLSAVYDTWRDMLVAGLAHAEAVIDFGDDERLDDALLDEDDQQLAQDNVWGGVVGNMEVLERSMRRQLQDARRGELVRQGLQIAIVGPPNAGKSSLFNILADRDAAIVSPTAGTTRDVLELSLNLGGVKCVLQDTAGVRTFTDDAIEMEGIARATRAAAQADLVLAMVDSSDVESGLEILTTILQNSPNLDRQHVLLLLNKSDLREEKHQTIEVAGKDVVELIGGQYEISCATQNGVDTFLESLTRICVARVSNTDASDRDKTSIVDRETSEGTLITRARHRQHVQAAVEALERFQTLSQQGTMSVDLAAEELRLAASEFGRITGAVDVEDVLDKLFADFCIGK
jgi:tRNA modification GTPase